MLQPREVSILEEEDYQYEQLGTLPSKERCRNIIHNLTANEYKKNMRKTLKYIKKLTNINRLI